MPSCIISLSILNNWFSWCEIRFIVILTWLLVESSDDMKYCEGEAAWGGSDGQQHKLVLGVCIPWENLREGICYALEGEPLIGGTRHQTTLGVLTVWHWVIDTSICWSCVQLGESEKRGSLCAIIQITLCSRAPLPSLLDIAPHAMIMGAVWLVLSSLMWCEECSIQNWFTSIGSSEIWNTGCVQCVGLYSQDWEVVLWVLLCIYIR